MARRNDRYIRLDDGQQLTVWKAEREKCRRMVEQFERKGLHKTVWHSDLERIEKAIRGLEEKGEK